MKQILFILLALLPVSMMGQHNHLSTTKDAGLVKLLATTNVSNRVLPDIKYYTIGKLWKGEETPTLTLCRDMEGNYNLSFLFSSYDGYYLLNQPTLILTDELGEEIELSLSPNRLICYQTLEVGGIGGIQEFRGNKHSDDEIYVHKTNYLRHTLIKYLSDMYFSVSNINEFAKHKFVKLSLCDGKLEYDLREGGTKAVNKFNKKLRKAVKHVNDG